MKYIFLFICICMCGCQSKKIIHNNEEIINDSTVVSSTIKEINDITGTTETTIEEIINEIVKDSVNHTITERTIQKNTHIASGLSLSNNISITTDTIHKRKQIIQEKQDIQVESNSNPFKYIFYSLIILLVILLIIKIL